MNAPIVRLYGLMLLLFAALVGFTSYWAVFDSDEPQGQSQNRRPLIVEQTVKRGTIKTADGVTVAESSPVGRRQAPGLRAQLPAGLVFGNPVGYSFIEAGRTGIERFENGLLAGERNEFTSIIDQLRDVPQEGDDVTLTIDAQTPSGWPPRRCSRRSPRPREPAGRAARWWRSTPPPGRSRRWPRCPASTPTLVKNATVLKQLNKPTRARRSSTGPPRAPISRARR